MVSISTGVSYPATNPGDLMNLLITVPPRVEYEAIATYLSTQTSHSDKLVNIEEQLIEKLKEYRSALITAAVTGQIDFREVPKQ